MHSLLCLLKGQVKLHPYETCTQMFIAVYLFFKKILFIHERHGEKERERERERERGRDIGRRRRRLHTGSLMWDWISGSQDHTLG